MTETNEPPQGGFLLGGVPVIFCNVSHIFYVLTIVCLNSRREGNDVMIRISTAMALVVTAISFMHSAPANAQINCATCVPAYHFCQASGATDCDTRYARCIAWCPDARKALLGGTSLPYRDSLISNEKNALPIKRSRS